MELGWINVFGTIIVAIILMPSIIYAIKNKSTKNKYENKLASILEQVGKYVSLVLTIFPVGSNGFNSVEYMLVYLIINAGLLLLYLIIWILYLKSKFLSNLLLLAIIPAIIFLICGITLRHWVLIISSIIFGVSHILITYKNNC